MESQNIPALTMPIYPGRRYRPLNAVIQFETVGIASWRDWITKMVDVVGGRAKTYDRPIVKALQDAINKVQAVAKDMSADAIIDLRISVVAVSSKGLGMAQVLVTGTAIMFEDSMGLEGSAGAAAHATPSAELPLMEKSGKLDQAYGFTLESFDVPQLGSGGNRASIIR